MSSLVTGKLSPQYLSLYYTNSIANFFRRAICHSDSRYPDASTFNPGRYLTSPTGPKLQGHTVFGYGRRVCIGQDYAASQLLVVCGAVANFFNISLPVDKTTGKSVSVESCFEGATGNVIPVLACVDLGFNARSEHMEGRLRAAYSVQRDVDLEREDEECL